MILPYAFGQKPDASLIPWTRSTEGQIEATLKPGSTYVLYGNTKEDIKIVGNGATMFIPDGEEWLIEAENQISLSNLTVAGGGKLTALSAALQDYTGITFADTANGIFINSAGNVLIKQCNFLRITDTGIWLNGGANCTVEQCEFKDFKTGARGIVNNASTLTVADSQFINIPFEAVAVWNLSLIHI